MYENRITYDNYYNDDSASRESQSQARRAAQAGHDGQQVDPVRAGGTVHTGFDDGAERTLSDGTVNEGTL
jgi:hypothetical protein